MIPESDIDPLLLAQYLRGSRADAVTTAVSAWVAADPSRTATLESLGRLQESLSVDLAHVETQRSEQWTALVQRLEAETGAPMMLSPAATVTSSELRRSSIALHDRQHGHRLGNAVRQGVGRHEGRRRTWIGGAVAAGVVAGVVASVAMWGVVRSTHSSLPTAAKEYVAAPGQQMLVTLADRTQIRLAPGSRLRVASSFNRTTRTVTLQGEAWFHVRATASVPFTVQTKNVITTVLGTTFAIRARNEEPVRVAVDDGRVSVGNRRSSMVLAAGTAARVTDSTMTRATATEPTQYTDWTAGQLVFNGASVPDVLATVGQWYGYDFRLADSALARRNVSVSFKMTDPADMMMLLKDVLDADLKFDGNTVTVVRRTTRSIDTKGHSSHSPLTPSVEMGK